ncbi:CPBP family intramembrane metalloprotease [Leucobacter insecticola]|uniref:CPBP family intramembrane metalloprotease n=1 Tax=Leucobacter insecticola TaxID=2714934 RepID=A0A6G8FJS5_9MICO|nr:CPBP family intramembrane glutamic endopeptidase [Leucobacter insecticola]QIM16696.1 CPBP family intramembrane metalloprotease [Leucobacter insecticola]
MTQVPPFQNRDQDGAARPDRLQRVPWGAVAVFVITACALAWLIALPLWIMGTKDPAFPVMLGLLASVMMFAPLLATLVVILVMKVPGKGARLRLLGLWPLRPAKRVVWLTVAAIFAPVVVVALSIAVAGILGWVTLDLTGFSGFAETVQASLPEGMSLPLPVGVLIALQFLSIPFGAVFNGLFAVGEEIGWRGWLLPALRPLGVWPALLVSGAIWGLWHSPVILLGYNFGLTDWRGVALMTIGCVFWGVLLGWSRLRSGSVWPAVFGHGALNASAGMAVILAAAGTELNPVLVSPLGAAGWIAVALVTLVLFLTGQFRKEPALAQDR